MLWFKLMLLFVLSLIMNLKTKLDLLVGSLRIRHRQIFENQTGFRSCMLNANNRRAACVRH